jgi:uncharacterized protein
MTAAAPRLLVLCGDRWHSPETVRVGLAGMEAELERGIDVVDDVAGWDLAQLARYPTVLLTKSNVLSASSLAPWLTNESATGFQQYVRAGHGLVVVHSGIASYREIAPMRALAGGCFTQHPPPCEVRLAPMANHPLAAGVEEFAVFDEHYFVEQDDPAVEVFLQAHSVHGVQPAGWTRTEGQGRICVLTPGHFPAVWQHPAFRRLLANAVKWAG